uniref:Uncharacterized protein n=1 Tax=Nelumbo nucifera TaxID=4432 RepID=A0A822ZPR0_NELNU|nr:TPA_asm: hypothetical protein HUJ06_016407 [Nelumbo nucifera]
MGQLGYHRVGKKWHYHHHHHHRHQTKGFRVNSRRFSVYRLRTRFLYLVGIMITGWKASYGQAVASIKKSISSCGRGRSFGHHRYPAVDSKLGSSSSYSYGRSSNSFYSEAIADCLEFIKRTSISVDENPIDRR